MSTTTPSPGRSELAALNTLLDERDVPAASRATILEAVAIAQTSRISVIAEGPDDDPYVALRPTGSTIAAYVHPDRLRLRFDRRRAMSTCQEYEFCEIEEGLEHDAPWLNLSIEDWAVEQHAIVVRRLLLSAIIIASVQPRTPPPRRTTTRAAGTGTARPSAGPRSDRTKTPINGHGAGTRPVDGALRVPAATPATSSRPAAPSLPPPVKPAVCPVHFVELINGNCDYCD